MRQVLLLTALIAASPAWANDEPNCKEPITQSDMNICSGLEYDEADRKLNEAWPKFMADAKEGDEFAGTREYRDALLASQRAWIAYRDAQCTWAGFEARGGSMEPLLVNSCLRHLTLERIKQLEEGMNP